MAKRTDHPAPPVVLITGSSRGIGLATAKHLAELECQVVATARNPADLDALIASHPTVVALALDVTEEASVNHAIEATVARFGRIDAIVNNAGYGLMLPVEEMTTAAVHAQFDVNLYGVHRVTRAALPHLRKQRSGRIIQVSSVAGYVPVPSMSIYSATKHALRAYTESLHMEVKPFGIHACLIEPGVIKTEFGTRSLQEQDKHGFDPEGPYAKLHRRWQRMRMLQGGAPPSVIARAIAHAVLSDRPRFHYIAPLSGKASVWSRKFLPEAVSRFILRVYFGLLRPMR